jgi:tetratricopeptide (TPR) repeat protein
MLGAGCSKPVDQNLLDQHRNLGKAFYENPTTQQEAVQEFQQALEIVPGSARDKLNYALALLKVQGREEEAIKLLQEVQRQDPSLPHTWFNLGIYYKHQGDTQRAIGQFEGMLARTPDEAIAHYQLGTLYNQVNRRKEGQAQFEKAAETSSGATMRKSTTRRRFARNRQFRRNRSSPTPGLKERLTQQPPA